jgi:hypothetical protein
MKQNSRGSGHRLRACAHLVDDDAVVTVIGCTGYPLWSVRIRWPWNPLDPETIAELDWLRSRTGVTVRPVVAALGRLGAQQYRDAA